MVSTRIFSSVLLASSTAGVLSLSANNVDRRTAIQQAGVAALGSITAGGLVIPNAQAAVDTINPIATLADGSKFPLASFGLQIYDDNTAYKLTLTALEVGYRNFFASVLAGNQRGFAKAIRDSSIPREDM